MNGYLMQEQDWMPGQDLFIESFSPENRYGVVFEDDGESAYFYAVEKDAEGAGLRILDALHIWSDDEEEEGSGGERGADREEADDAGEQGESGGGESPGEGGDAGEPGEGDADEEAGQDNAADDAADGDTDGPSRLLLVWARDWMKCALVIDGACEALYDFAAQGGYNIDEFPPPNEFWTKGDRKLTDDLVKKLF
jgi:hypothetical protein